MDNLKSCANSENYDLLRHFCVKKDSTSNWLKNLTL